MPKNATIDVKSLSLDLKNFRTVPQTSEKDAIHAMIAISNDRFYAVMDSIIEDGYTPTENVIVLDEGTKKIVKEGNRRIACLKIILGIYKPDDFNIPKDIIDKIAKLDVTYKKNNSAVPCYVYQKSEESKLDRVISLVHGKGEKASRENWAAVARARHNRDVNSVSEPALDLLEAYLEKGNNLTNQQKERWAGDYAITVLAEAIRLLYTRLGYTNATTMVAAYPKVAGIPGIEDMLRDIGLNQLTFKILRDPHTDFALNYGVKPIVVAPPPPHAGGGTTSPGDGGTGGKVTPLGGVTPAKGSTPTPASSGGIKPPTPTVPAPLPPPPPAYAINDPRRVKQILKKFSPSGTNRSKVVTLLREMDDLNLKKNPIAFCFLLRSIFEISARAYSKDHSLPVTKTKKGNISDMTLSEILESCTKHLTNNSSNKAVVKNLHGALTELKKPTGILSVTSLNRLVHDDTFTVTPSDVCTLFGQVYPLLEYLN